MNKMLIKAIDKLVKNSIKLNINSTTSLAAYQPAMSSKIKAAIKKDK